jgi:hypothetical protein
MLTLGCASPTSPGASNPAPTSPAPPPTPSTTYQGTVAAATGQTGTIDIIVQTVIAAARPAVWSLFVAPLEAQAVTATGTMRLAGGATTALTGTFNSGSLNLAGSGIAVDGRVERGVLAGTLSGALQGGFSSLTTTGSLVTRYCGTFTGRDSDTAEEYRGIFNLQVSDNGQASGLAVVTAAQRSPQFVGAVNHLTGQVSGATVTISGTDGGGIGTIREGTVSGTGNNNTVFSGSTGACR